MSIGFHMVRYHRHQGLSFQGLAAQGAKCRWEFLRLVRHLIQEKNVIHDGLTVEDILMDSSSWASPEEYLVQMSQSQSEIDRSKWGGFAEAAVLAFYWRVRVGFFALDTSRTAVFLLMDPAGPTDEALPHICLLWNGTHYEAMQMDDATWKVACTHESD